MCALHYKVSRYEANFKVLRADKRKQEPAFIHNLSWQ
jgi:hypothetical protein